MNRRGFFGMLGGTAATAVGLAAVQAEAVPVARSVEPFPEWRPLIAGWTHEEIVVNAKTHDVISTNDEYNSWSSSEWSTSQLMAAPYPSTYASVPIVSYNSTAASLSSGLWYLFPTYRYKHREIYTKWNWIQSADNERLKTESDLSQFALAEALNLLKW